MKLEDIANDDIIAGSIWTMFGLVCGRKALVLAATEPFSVSMIGPIIGTICGAFIGYRHVQNLAMIARARVRRDQRRDEMQHELEMARLGKVAKPAAEIDSEFPFDCKQSAKPDEDTIDLP